VDDKRIFSLIKQGNEDAFNKLFRAYYSKLCHYAVMLGCCGEDAEEIVQELFTKLWMNRQKTEIDISAKSYLYKSTRNAVINLVEHQRIKQKYAGEEILAKTEFFDVNPLLVAELQEHIQSAINKLSEGRKQIFILSRSDGLSYQEIAEKLNISPKTVENQMGHALKQLREELKDYLPMILVSGLAYFFCEWGYLCT